MPRRRKSEYRKALEFAAILAVAGVAAAAFALLRHHGTRAALFAGIGLGALLLALAARPVWLSLFRLWMKLAEGLGWVMTRVILTIFYYGILTPFGWLRRVAGRPSLDTAWRDGKATYWIDREAVEPTIDRYAKRY